MKAINIKTKCIYTILMVWLALPSIIFLVTWIKPLVGIPMTALLLCGIFAPKNGLYSTIAKKEDLVTISLRNLIIITSFSVALIVISGIGGFVYQMWDHLFRNELFRQLVYNPWPVINYDLESPRLFTYYFAFWLPAAVVAKLTSSILIGELFMIIYGAVGIGAVLLLMLRDANSATRILLCLGVFVLLCPWNWIIVMLRTKMSFWDIIFFPTGVQAFWFYSVPTTMDTFFWIYNQGIPAWVGCALLFAFREKPQNLLLTYSFLLFFSPIICVGLFPVVAWALLRNFRKSITLPNVAAILLCLIFAAYFSTTTSPKSTILSVYSLRYIICGAFMSVLVAYGVYMPLIWNQIKRDKLFWTLLLWSLVVSMFRIGTYFDLGWRVGIPCMVYFMYLLIKRLSICKLKSMTAIVFFTALIIGLPGNFTYAQLIRGEYQHFKNGIPLRRDSLTNLWDPHQNPVISNFAGNIDTFFGKYLMK